MSDENEVVEAPVKPAEEVPEPATTTSSEQGPQEDIVIVPIVCMACWAAFEWGTTPSTELPEDAACPFCGKGPVQPVGKVLMALGRGLQMLERGVSVALGKVDELETRVAGMELLNKPIGGPRR